MSKLISRETLSDLDFKKLGLICGLEIHQPVGYWEVVLQVSFTNSFK